jgi:hypothetical protein
MLTTFQVCGHSHVRAYKGSRQMPICRKRSRHKKRAYTSRPRGMWALSPGGRTPRPGALRPGLVAGTDDILEGSFDIGLTDQDLVRVATARALYLEFFRPSPAETLRIDPNARWCLLACLGAGVEQRGHLTLHSKLPSPELVWRRQEVLAVQYCSLAERSMTVFTRHSLVPDSSCYGLGPGGGSPARAG